MGEAFGKTTTLEIRTPEGVIFSQPLASPVLRFLAWSIDLAILGVLQMGVKLVLSPLVIVSHDVMMGLLIGSYFIIGIGYAMFLEWLWAGQTVGKRVLGLRVIDENGLTLKGTQVVMRNLVRALDAMPMFYFVGGVACLLSRRSQRLGDLAAGTLVVRNPKSRQPRIQDVIGTAYLNSFADHPHLEARLRQKVTPEEGLMVMNALVRRDDLGALDRVALFAEMADYFRDLVTFPDEAVVGLSDEQYLRNVVDTVFRARR